MSLLWLLFVNLAVIGSVSYTTGMKLGAPSMNAFGFVFFMNVVVLSAEALFLLIAKYGFKVDVMQGVNANSLTFALLSGLGAATVDLCYFLSMHYGPAISSQLYWTVGALVGFAFISVLFFGEAVSWTKALGMVFGIASVVLIVKAS